MAIAVDQNYDKAQRKISTANLEQFAGVDCQLLVEKETHRPIIMDGATIGGKFKCASTDELKVVETVANNAISQAYADEHYLGKTEKAVSAGTADSATKATQDASGNVITSTYATKAEAVRSINNTSPDKNGNITPSQTGCLPLSGGTITGAISFKNGSYIFATDTDQDESIDIAYNGWSSGGAALTLKSVNSPNYAGEFGLMASNGNASKVLIGTPGGLLQWGGVNIARSINGINADNNGNVVTEIVIQDWQKGSSFRLPNYGAWSGVYFDVSPNGDFCAPHSFKNVSGGTTFTGSSPSYVVAFAIRVS